MSIIKFVLSSFSIALILWSTANADDYNPMVIHTPWKQPANAYPWDSTAHPACSDEKRKRKPVFCEKEPDWPDYDTTKDRVVKLIYQKDVNLLTKAEKELAYSKERFPTGEYVFEAWNDAVSYYFRAPDSDNYRANISDAWIKAQDGKGFSIISKALLRYNKGTSPALFNYFQPRKNSPGTIVNYLKSLKTANAVLDSASSKVKETALWFELKLTIAYQLPELKPRADELFKNAVQTWPNYPPLYGIAYAYSSPQYGGSKKAMENIVDKAIKNTKPNTGIAIYPLLTISSWKIPGYDPSSAHEKMDWKLMTQGFKDYEKHLGGSLVNFFKFAEMACRKRDKETARHFYTRHESMLKEKRHNSPFAGRGNPQKNECRDWAFSDESIQQNSSPLPASQPGI